ncbi:MAG: type II toxin-antitoxin system ParD family antitoxin [Phycisphaerae bacterium]
MSISLSPAQQRFVDELIQSGQYRSVEEVVSEALDILKSRDLDAAANLARLRADIALAAEQFERGEGRTLDVEDLKRRARLGREKCA